MHHDIHLLGEQREVCVVEAADRVLTARQREAHSSGVLRRRRGAGARERGTEPPAVLLVDEAVVVVGLGLQPGELRLDDAVVARAGGYVHRDDQAPHPDVGCDQEHQAEVLAGMVVVLQSRPQDHAVGPRVERSDRLREEAPAGIDPAALSAPDETVGVVPGQRNQRRTG